MIEDVQKLRIMLISQQQYEKIGYTVFGII